MTETVKTINRLVRTVNALIIALFVVAMVTMLFGFLVGHKLGMEKVQTELIERELGAIDPQSGKFVYITDEEW